MCDYSTMHLKQVKAEIGQTYKINNRVAHGFVTLDTPNRVRTIDKITAACVVHGQQLKLTGLTINHYGCSSIPKTATVKVVQRKEVANPKLTLAKVFRQWGSWNDFIEFPTGEVVPIALIVRCRMTVVDPTPKPRKRNLVKVLGLDQPDTSVKGVHDVAQDFVVNELLHTK